MIANVALFILWFLVWLFLSWPPNAGDVITGVLVSLMVCLVTADTLRETYGKGYTPALKREGLLANILRPLWFLYYAVVFIWECIKANIDVAFRVLHPDLPIRPGTIKVKTSLKSDIGLTFLANSITLTPGTTSVDIDKDRGYLYVHMLYIKEPRGKLSVVDKFEGILRKVFE